MRVFGLTGGIATGKSTVGRLLAERGLAVIDADQVAREVVAPGSPTLAAVAAAFGPEVLLDGALNRAALRARISSSESDRMQLNAIMHPAIGAAIGARLQDLAAKNTPAAFVEAALMVETGSYRMYPALIVVTCSAKTQLARVMARDEQTEAQARALIATQLPLADKEAVATHLIRNDGSPAELAEKVDALVAELALT